MSEGFPVSGVIDAHTHLMPDRLMTAIRESLSDAAGWSFDHPTDLDSMTAALERAGVERCFALPYAHRPGVAAELNEWICETTADSEMVVPFATVHAADEDVGGIVESAFEQGARGLKFQLPVQGFGADDPHLDPAYEVAAEWDCPVLFHAGTAPMFRDDPAVGIERFRSFVDSYPEIRACGAHMGTYEHEAFMDLARDRENVFLDTTFAMSAVAETYMDFDPSVIADDELTALSDRIMYGSDYPNIPYPYDRERAHLLERDLSTETQRDIFFRTARRFLGEL
ncbi:amidohydrolase family protein [Halorientalis salina]|uniref:amidohydrolase family protein n=1 Tax=Halorientalis salina TaxID=2932266 RepID=UPI0010AD185C|nr:amidohydrolase family protein [Halorientalis salina]